jgi:cell division septum initiation protein DivIVA
MTPDRRGDFPIVRRGYDTGRVDRRLDEIAAELDRLATENRALHRSLLDATVERDGITAPVRAELEAARVELDQLIGAAHAERERAVADVAAARAELDRLAQLDRDRAFTEVEAARADRDVAITEGAAARDDRDQLLAEVAAARAELIALQAFAGEPAVADLQSANAERDRVMAEVHAARAELDRLLRARVGVHQELSTLGAALRRWLGESVSGDGGQFRPPPSRALAPRQPGPVSRNPR